MNVQVKIINSISSREVLKYHWVLKEKAIEYFRSQKMKEEEYTPILNQMIGFLEPILAENLKDITLLDAVRDDIIIELKKGK